MVIQKWILGFYVGMVAMAGCSSSKSKTSSPAGSDSSATNSSSSGDTVNTGSLSLAGVAQGYITSGYQGVGTLGLGLVDADACASGSYEIYGLGYDTAFSTGTYSDSTFSNAQVPTGDAYLKVTCSDGTVQKCFAKAGDAGIICNKTASLLIDALGSALGKSLSDSAFRDAAIAKIASSIIDASLIQSGENDALIADLKACADAPDQGSCAKDAFSKSSLFDAFKILQKAATGWDAEGLFLFVTSILGKDIYLDSELYGPIFDALAKARGDGFIEAIRDLIGKVVVSQKAQDGKYAFMIKCQVSINGDSKSFDPDLDANSHLACNKDQLSVVLARAGIDLSHLDDIYNNNLQGQVACTVTQNNPSGQCWANLSMIATAASAREANRNDIDGTHTSNRGGNDRGVSLVDVMPQVMNDIAAENLAGGDGPIENMSPEQLATFQKILANDQKYFLGLVGVYSFLNGSAGHLKLSLNSIHDIFSSGDFMRNRLTTWGQNLIGVQVQGSNGSFYANPLLVPTSTLGVYTVPDSFYWNFSQGAPSNSQAMTGDQFDTIFSQSALSFNDTFAMFKNIPTAKEIKDFVYNSSHHEEWNPMGSKYISVAELGATSLPIACALNNAGPGQSLIAGTTVSCDSVGTGVSCDSNGYCTFPSGYAYPYILMERGWYGDDQGRMFSFASRSTGVELRSNGGQGVIVKEYKAGNPTGHCDASQVGSIVSYFEQFYCGSNTTCQQQVTAYCMDMSALGTPARKRFYPGGNYTVTNTSPDGQRWDWQVPLIGVYDGADHANDYSACLVVPSGTYMSASSQGNLASLNVNTSTGYVSLPVGAAVQACSQDAGNGNVKYYLYNWQDFAGTDAMYAYLLDPTLKTTLQFTNQIDSASNNWQASYARISQADIQSLLNGKTVAGSAATQINSMRFHNPRHDEKFDPYCDDKNGNGACDCYAIKTLSDDGLTATYENTVRQDPAQCGLLDKAAEPTISQLPYCAQCDNASDAIAFFDAFGGKAGADLAGVMTFFQSHQPNFDTMSAVNCQFKFAGESQPSQPTGIDWSHWDSSNHQGCPAADGETRSASSQGPIRVINPKPMNNAYNIERPATLLKLINYATKTVGQGVAVDPDAKVFSLDEAMALVAVRNLMPPNKIKVVDSQGNEIMGISPAFEPIQNPGKDSDPMSSMLKGLMFKVGIYTQDDLNVQQSGH